MISTKIIVRWLQNRGYSQLTKKKRSKKEHINLISYTTASWREAISVINISQQRIYLAKIQISQERKSHYNTHLISLHHNIPKQDREGLVA